MTKRDCKHCGLALVGAENSDFCCPGCATVYRIVHELGLENFYAIRDRAGEAGRPASVEDARYLYLDHTEEQKDVVEALSGNHHRTRFSLDGVHCSACIWIIEKLREVVPGVIQSQVDFGRAEVTVDYDPRVVKLSRIASQLNLMGYIPRPLSAGDDEAGDRLSEKENQSQLIRVGVAGFCAANLMMIAVSLYEGAFSGIAREYLAFFQAVSVVLAIPVVTYCSWPFYQRATQGLRAGLVHMDLTISLAIVGAFAISVRNFLFHREAIYFESLAALVFLLLLGRWIQWITLRKVRRSVKKRRGMLPAYAVLENGDEVPLRALRPNDRIRVLAGERIPADGKVISGSSSVDRSVLTGESNLFAVTSGDSVLAGSLNADAPLILAVGKVGPDSEIGKIEALVRNSTHNKTPFLMWVDRLSRYFLFSILTVAVGTLVIGTAWLGLDEALDRVVALLIVSCPCALGLATPLALSFAIGAGVKKGILIRNVEILEKLLRLRWAIFDKTGTLTAGDFRVCEVIWNSRNEADQKQWLGLVYALESQVRHPLARALSEYALAQTGGAPASPVSAPPSFQTVPGRGLRTHDAQGNLWRLGSLTWLAEEGVELAGAGQVSSRSTAIGLARQRECLAVFMLEDRVREEASAVIDFLRRQGCEIEILSGDRQEVVDEVAKQVHVSSRHANGTLSPVAKVEKIRRRRGELAGSGNVMMVGDGVNDAAALAEADIGVGLASGEGLALQGAPICLVRNDLCLVMGAVELSRETRRVILRNFAFSLVYNLSGSALAVVGIVNPFVAAVLMPVSSLTVVFSTVFARAFR